VIWPSPLAESVDRRARNRATRKGASLVIAFVAGGAALGSWLLPPAPTPTDVAQAYVEARFDRDWEEAWSLVCREDRTLYGDYTAYAEQSDYVFRRYFMPTDVDVTTGSAHSGPIGGSAAVTVSVTTPDGGMFLNWEIGGDVPVVAEDGGLRVCGQDTGLPAM
jgi:hypothetical protein